MRRPGLITLIAVIDVVSGVSAFLLGALALVGTFVGQKDDVPATVVLGGFCLLIGSALLVTAVGLLRLKGWARTARVVIACVALLGVPCGTLISVLVLIYLFKPGIRVLFSGRSPAEWTPLEAQQVAELPKRSTLAVVLIGAAVVGLAVVGLVAAIAIPSLLHARNPHNEAMAIGDVRTVISSEVGYQQVDGGRYGTIECLAAPASCIAGYTGPEFIDPATAKGVKLGYRYTLTLSADRRHYTYLAVPVTPGETGSRVFCGNETGLICQAPVVTDRSGPEIVCDASRCTPL